MGRQTLKGEIKMDKKSLFMRLMETGNLEDTMGKEKAEEINAATDFILDNLGEKYFDIVGEVMIILSLTQPSPEETIATFVALCGTAAVLYRELLIEKGVDLSAVEKK